MGELSRRAAMREHLWIDQLLAEQEEAFALNAKQELRRPRQPLEP